MLKTSKSAVPAPRDDAPRSGIVLRFADLRAAGLDVRLDDHSDWVAISGSSILSQEALESARDFAAELKLNPGDEENLIEYAVNLSVWAAIRRVTSP